MFLLVGLCMYFILLKYCKWVGLSWYNVWDDGVFVEGLLVWSG